MNSAELIETQEWSFAYLIGYEENPLLTVNSEIIIHTWIIMILLALALAGINYILRYTTIGRFLLLQFVSFLLSSRSNNQLDGTLLKFCKWIELSLSF